MKKLIIIALLFAACKSTSHNGTYVNRIEDQYDRIVIVSTIYIKLP